MIIKSNEKGAYGIGRMRQGCTNMHVKARFATKKEVAKALADPELNRKLGELAIQLSGSTPEELGAFIRNEHDKWGKLIKDVKLNLEQ